MIATPLRTLVNNVSSQLRPAQTQMLTSLTTLFNPAILPTDVEWGQNFMVSIAQGQRVSQSDIVRMVSVLSGVRPIVLL